MPINIEDNNMITYRKMELADSQAVYRLYGTCFSEPWTLDAIREMFVTKGYHSLLAVSGKDEIVAYVGLKSVLDEADITNVAVNPAFRRQGIAHELLRRLLSYAVDAGIRSIFLEVRASNEAAITLYDHAGFKKCGIRKKYYTKPDEDAVLMVWNQ